MKTLFLYLLLLFSASVLGQDGKTGRKINPAMMNRWDGYFALTIEKRISYFKSMLKPGTSATDFFFVSDDIKALSGDTTSVSSYIRYSFFTDRIESYDVKKINKLCRKWKAMLKNKQAQEAPAPYSPPDYTKCTSSNDSIVIFTGAYVLNSICNRIKLLETYVSVLSVDEIIMVCTDIDAITGSNAFKPELNQNGGVIDTALINRLIARWRYKYCE